MPPARKRPVKRVTRYTYDANEPRIPETGHSGMLPEEETVVSVPMNNNGWVEGMVTASLPDEDATYLLDMDPSVDPLLVWSGKRNRRDVPVLPLQRNEIVTESRLNQIIDRARQNAAKDEWIQSSFFADLEKELRETDKGKRVEFYTHGEQWRNKLICGDSLPVMESLIRYEGLLGGVQMIYMDPPYGIAYDSNFQQRVDSIKNEKNDLADDVLTIKAFRDTWALGVHSYLSYLIERLYLCRELLTHTGSMFLQMGEENVHRARMTLDEVFGAENFVAQIAFNTTGGQASALLPSVCDYLLWYAKDRDAVHFRQLYTAKDLGGAGTSKYKSVELPDGSRCPLSRAYDEDGNLLAGAHIFRKDNLTSQGYRQGTTVDYVYEGVPYHPGDESHWKITPAGLDVLASISRLTKEGKSLSYVRYLDDFPAFELGNMWTDIGGIQSRADPKVYAVQTGLKAILRCVAMTTEPGDLIFDPTCGSGTSAIVAERLGRRWVTCDTSRVAINVARRRILSTIFDQYQTLGDGPASGFRYSTLDHVTASSLAYGLEPEQVHLVDQPLRDDTAVRVTGPFEVDTLGRYSVEDWKGYLASGKQEAEKLENYVEVICRLYRPDAEVGGGTGLLHALEDLEDGLLAISVGPLTGRISAAQVCDAAREAEQLNVTSLHLLGWAFEANVGEVKNSLDARADIQLIMIRPDALADGLRVTQPDLLFSPLALPEVKIEKRVKRMFAVTLDGVGLFDRKTRSTAYHRADDGYIQAWYLDEDYDGDCFVDCQMFFDFKRVPNLKSIAGAAIDRGEFIMKFTSEEFARGHYGRIAVRVVDVYGNESTLVKDLP